MKFHPGHKTKTGGHEFAINDHGTAVQLSIAGGSSVVEITGAEAQELRNWLSAAELRTDDEHAAVMADEAKNPTKEINSGIKVEMNDGTLLKDGTVAGDGTHQFANSPEELEMLQSQAAANLADRTSRQKKILADWLSKEASASAAAKNKIAELRAAAKS